MDLKTWGSTLRLSYSAWNDHDAPKSGAALAFYTMLSLAPLLILIVAIVGLAFGEKAAESQIANQVRDMVGEEGAKAIQTLIVNARKPSSGVIATVIGLITLLFGASSVFGELRSTLNKIWKAEASNAASIWLIVKERLFSFGMVFAIGFLLLVSLTISAALAAAGKFFSDLLPIAPFVLGIIYFLFSFAAITILFALIYKFVPAAKVAWRDVWVGAIATAFLFTLGKTLIGLYLGKAGIGSAYGAAGSLIVVIVWVYYSAQIFFFGAEFTYAYAHTIGSRSPDS